MMKPDYYYFDYSQLKGLHCDDQPIWSLGLFDSRSNLQYLLYIACPKPTSLHVTNFLVKAFQQCGIPAGLYVDADELIRSPRMQAFAAMVREHGFPFRIEQISIGTPRSIGRLESSRRVVEAYEKLIDVTRRAPDLESLNAFALHVFQCFAAASASWPRHPQPHFVHVALPSGGSAVVTENISRETPTALDQMLRAAAQSRSKSQ